MDSCCRFARVILGVAVAGVFAAGTTNGEPFNPDHFDDNATLQRVIEHKEGVKFAPEFLPCKSAEELPYPQEYLESMQNSEKVRAQSGNGPTPTNDLCADAVDVGALPAVVAGTTLGATFDADAPFCGTTVESDSAGVWYVVTGTGNTMTATTCDGVFAGATADYDTKINVYCGDCTGLTCVGGNDDDAANGCGFDGGTGNRRSTVTWCSEAGTDYLILVHGFCCLAPLDGVGNFALAVFESGGACSDPPSCGGGGGPLECPPGAGIESEPICFDGYEDVSNGGCNSIPPVFGAIQCGQTICGTSGTFLSSTGDQFRDTDWLSVTLASAQSLTWTVEAQFPVLIGVVDNGGVDDCTGVSAFLDFATADPLTPVSVTVNVPAGTWWVFISPSDFVGVPCGAGWVGSLTCAGVPDGACCFADGSCSDGLAEADCINQGGFYQGDGSDCANVSCPVLGENDFCEDAIAISVPSSTAGSTFGATTDSEFPFCGTGITSPGVWYSVTGTGNTMFAETCAFASYDTKISIYCGSCLEPTCVDGNDDACGLQSGVAWCSQAGAEYLVLVHGFGGQSGDFLLDVFDDGQACSADVLCLAEGACCFSDGTCAQATEGDCLAQGGEYAGDGVQCGSTFVASYELTDCANGFVDISGTGTELFLGDDAGQVVPLGFSFNFFGDNHTDIAVCSNGYLTFGGDLTDFSNDPIPTATDPNDIICPLWDDLDPTLGGSIHYQTMGTSPNQMFIAQWTDISQFANTDSNTFQAILMEGSNQVELRYGSFTPEAFAGDYTIGIENQDGTVGTAANAGNVAPGDCLNFEFTVEEIPNVAFVAEDCSNSFVDISGTGTELFLGDDSGQVVPLGFSFAFYGDSHTDIAVCSNGYLTFGGDLTDFSNDPIPTATDPNNIICPLWDDLDPTLGGSIHYQTMGTSPNQMFIAQWTDISQFANTDSNTFQAILMEGSNAIELRYGTFTPEAFAGDYTIGVENQSGTDGLGINAGGVAPGDCLRFAEVAFEDPCNQAPDCGDPVTLEFWPPNHRWESIDVAALSGAVDPDGDALTFTVDSITQDESTNAEGDGNTCPDGDGVGTGTAMIRVERAGGGNGRVYNINYTADDGNGGTCSGTIAVEIPHDQSPSGAAVDDGQAFDSTDCGGNGQADVNADGLVDISDLRRVLLDLGLGVVNFNGPDADANLDMVVSMRDFIYVIRQMRPEITGDNEPSNF